MNLNLQQTEVALRQLLAEKPVALLEAVRISVPLVDAIGDGVVTAAQRERAVTELNIKRQRNVMIQLVLDRIKTGEFPACVECEEEIPKKRLVTMFDHVSAGLFCCGCQERLERHELPDFEHLAPPLPQSTVIYC